MSRRPRGPQRPTPIRRPTVPLSRVRAAVRPRPQAGAGVRRPEGPGPAAPPGADEPAGDRPRDRAVPVVAPGVRQRPIPGGDAARPRAAQKKSGPLILEADEMWSFVGGKADVWWVWAALD